MPERSNDSHRGLSDCARLLKLPIHPPKQGLVIIDERRNLVRWEGISGAGTTKLVQSDHARQVPQDISIPIICIHRQARGRKQALGRKEMCLLKKISFKVILLVSLHNSDVHLELIVKQEFFYCSIDDDESSSGLT